MTWVESETLKAKGVEYRPFAEVLSDSDIISLHCPLNAETQHIINSISLSKMKKGGYAHQYRQRWINQNFARN